MARPKTSPQQKSSGRSSPRRRQSPRKQPQTPPSALKVDPDDDSSDVVSADDRRNEQQEDIVPKKYSDEFIASLTDMLEYYAEMVVHVAREERMAMFLTFTVSKSSNRHLFFVFSFFSQIMLYPNTGILGHPSHAQT